jgi:anti-sigma factor RsiW
MREHESVRELLALAVAGALSVEEQRRLEDHVSACEQCSRELESWRAVSAALRRMPTPAAPPEMVERTRARVFGELAAAAQRRWDDAVLAFLSLFAWVVGLTAWAIVRVLGSGLTALFDAQFTQTLTWMSVSSVLAWLTAGVVVVLVGHRRRVAWRSL